LTRPKKKRRLSRREGLNVLRRVDDKMSRFVDLKFSEFVQLRNDMRILIETYPDLASSPDMLEVFEVLDEVIKFHSDMTVVVNQFENFITKASKQIEREEAQQPEPVKHLCINCNRRERRVDEYCKRCADELGIRPRGKI
jgi:hypothetical protein